MLPSQGSAKKAIRALFVSDLHLGCRHAQSAAFLSFLRTLAPRRVYLVGDIIDGWRLKRRWFWDPDAVEIAETLVNLARDGVRILYTPGNHDDFLRGDPRLNRLVRRAGIELRDEFLHRTADGRRFLVTHGDQFDSVECGARWLSLIGTSSYNLLLAVDRAAHQVRRPDEPCRYRLSAAVKRRVKRAVAHVSDFESRIIAYARGQKCCGVICGHSHTPRICVRLGITYCNTGDWVENCTALIEDTEGRLRLVGRHKCGEMRLTAIEGHAAVVEEECVDQSMHAASIDA